MVVCCRASPKRSRSRQSNESAVGSVDAMEIQKNHKNKRLLRFLKAAQLRNDRWSATSTMSNAKKCKHEQGYTQTDVREFDRLAVERKMHVATL